ncbi:MAG TPA: hypothetical protein VM940_06170 [Chthoniobacterales bacterium]|jgi:hypothetical protein|nr:hypothetical protein [Chthoniobacterales bacterium]
MKKSFLFAGLIVAGLLCAAEPDSDPCALVPKEEVAKIIGEIKEGPTPHEGLMKEKECRWTNMSGSWLSIGLYSSEKWDLKKGSGNNPTDVKGLGDEAFTDKRGTDAEIYVRKGKWMLEVRTSSGSANARKVADYAITKMP